MKLHYVGGKVVDCMVTKDARKYIYFLPDNSYTKYRVDKTTGAVSVAPYWDVVKGMYVEV